MERKRTRSTHWRESSVHSKAGSSRSSDFRTEYTFRNVDFRSAIDTPTKSLHRERERVKKIERQRKVLWRTSCFGVSYVTFIDRTRPIIYRMDCIFYELHKFAVTYYSYLGISIFYRDPYSNFCVYTL